MATNGKAQRGFTLLEVLVAMALVTLISLVVMGSVGPWLALKQKLDNERKLQDVKNGVASLYATKAMAIELQPGGTLDAFATSTLANGQCPAQLAAFEANADRFSESPQQIARDGYANPWCIVVSGQLNELKDGVRLYYRNISFVSAGPNGEISPLSTVRADGTVALGDDDVAVTVSGRDIQAEKLKETLRRMNRVGQMFETYFTTRYLANSNRDITIYYFNSLADPGGAVGNTGGAWANASTLLQSIGVGPTDAYTPWESDNHIQVANYNEEINGSMVRSPVTYGTGVLPYTALLRARVPSPANAPSYAVQSVIGNY